MLDEFREKSDHTYNYMYMCEDSARMYTHARESLAIYSPYLAGSFPPTCDGGLVCSCIFPFWFNFLLTEQTSWRTYFFMPCASVYGIPFSSLWVSEARKTTNYTSAVSVVITTTVLAERAARTVVDPGKRFPCPAGQEYHGSSRRNQKTDGEPPTPCLVQSFLACPVDAF